MIGPGTAIENAVGGSGKDKIIGNGLANVLSGGGGRDSLIGGDGPDGFLFNVKPGPANLDTIRDFVAGEDFIRLARKVFDALSLGAVSEAAFDSHFDYSRGVLEYHGKAIAKLIGAPVIDEGDLLVV
jgi:Ca2+-binding RTX toxin-like protein